LQGYYRVNRNISGAMFFGTQIDAIQSHHGLAAIVSSRTPRHVVDDLGRVHGEIRYRYVPIQMYALGRVEPCTQVNVLNNQSAGVCLAIEGYMNL
jgi:hypothetical protein